MDNNQKGSTRARGRPPKSDLELRKLLEFALVSPRSDSARAIREAVETERSSAVRRASHRPIGSCSNDEATLSRVAHHLIANPAGDLKSAVRAVLQQVKPYNTNTYRRISAKFQSWFTADHKKIIQEEAALREATQPYDHGDDANAPTLTLRRVSHDPQLRETLCRAGWTYLRQLGPDEWLIQRDLLGVTNELPTCWEDFARIGYACTPEGNLSQLPIIIKSRRKTAA